MSGTISDRAGLIWPATQDPKMNLIFCRTNESHAGSVAIRRLPLKQPRLLSRGVVVAIWALATSAGSSFAGPMDTLATFNFNTNFNGQGGTVMVDLFDVVTPATVANFNNYATGDASHTYNNVVLHRSIANFIVQGGGYHADQLFTGNAPNQIAAFAPVTNEFHLSNLRGTIAMAKLPGNPNSATSEWFFNLGDNSANLNAQNGGFTVFGQVVGTGMTNVVDPIANSQPTTAQLPNGFTFDGLQNFPLKDYTLADLQASKAVTAANIFVLNNVTLSTHPAFQNPLNSLDVNNDGLVHPSDANTIITDLLDHSNQSHAVGLQDVGTVFEYIDVNGDGVINASDVHLVIDALLNQSPSGAPTPSLMATTSMSVVPEPSSWILAAAGMLALGGYVLRRRRRQSADLRLSH
jgi:peptidyl-prolyl cis-trans isomerase A (cyclophilin A)